MNFVASYDSPQKLVTNQSVTAYAYDYDTGEVSPSGTTINGGSGTNAVYLRPDMPYDMLGGTIDVSRLETSGEITYMTLYAYKPTTADEMPRTTNNAIEVDFAVADTTKQIDFKVPAGKYILPFKNTRNGITSLTMTLKIGNGAATTVYTVDGKTSQFKNIGVYYLNIDLSSAGSSDTETLTITLNKGSISEEIKFLIYPLYKYVMPDIISNDVGLAIMNKMFELDEYSYYNYTYQVSNDVEIANPLLATSFESINHIFNQNTICQMNNKELTLDITNKIK